MMTFTSSIFRYLVLASFCAAMTLSSAYAQSSDDLFQPTIPQKIERAAPAIHKPATQIIPPAPHKGDGPEYQLGAGDVLKITIFNEPDLSGEFKVDGSGKIALPLVGNILVGNKTLRQVEKTIATAYADGYLINPSVNAEVLNYRPFYILGEVQNPGSYPYVEGINVMNAVALAGGFTYRAKEDMVLITRANNNNEKKENFKPDAVILPGDIIEVQERFF